LIYNLSVLISNLTDVDGSLTHILEVCHSLVSSASVLTLVQSSLLTVYITILTSVIKAHFHVKNKVDIVFLKIGTKAISPGIGLFEKLEEFVLERC